MLGDLVQEKLAVCKYSMPPSCQIQSSVVHTAGGGRRVIPTKAVEPTPNSFRSCRAPAIKRGSRRAVGFAKIKKDKKSGKTTTCSLGSRWKRQGIMNA